MHVTQAKAELRARHTALRKTQIKTQNQNRAQQDEGVVRQTLACMGYYGAVDKKISAYAPLPTEPGPADYAARLARHATVWLPISLPDHTLAWAKHHPDTPDVPGALGISEPAGERFGAEVLAECALLIVPALAVDRRGMRLGKGAGYYDRALTQVDVPVAAVVFDHEVVGAVPHDAHDMPVDAVITPTTFLVL